MQVSRVSLLRNGLLSPMCYDSQKRVKRRRVENQDRPQGASAVQAWTRESGTPTPTRGLQSSNQRYERNLSKSYSAGTERKRVIPKHPIGHNLTFKQTGGPRGPGGWQRHSTLLVGVKGGGEVTRSNGRKRASRKTETAAWIKILRSQRRCLELVIGKLGESLHVFHARTTKVLTGLVGPCSWLWASQVSSHLFTDVPTEARRATCLTLGEVREHPSHTTTLRCVLPFTLPVGKREHCWLKPIGESTLSCLRNFTPLSFLM